MIRRVVNSIFSYILSYSGEKIIKVIDKYMIKWLTENYLIILIKHVNKLILFVNNARHSPPPPILIKNMQMPTPNEWIANH
jgi:hypothetical protein